MRIWDVEPKYLCRKHLLAEHRELHGLWNILTKHGGKGGYSHHPETRRWVGKTSALYNRHEALIREFIRRGYHHYTPLDKKLARGKAVQDSFINTIPEQKLILQNKGCDCLVKPFKASLKNAIIKLT
ncbi:pyrimidine dimer DNA glycosylase [Candidatus Falkowbacteria bacterium CG10_big_fil_rev_8_21_14_0_10_39_9]|uniref:Pyrimidine dimer DNA glycosylase n=1 Tax=Candidatus Falkowbacteria bacterium CG10_big_fil_rev_8_21_14_0_10_39_9 TaxID=1974566 RepID=A0A2M6WNJ3_9BACT|nr:MAG: pyrimidine dimer DNA glycosylase [Candidatus Falkowbacteria bacterium CG10_big_fil_rev_8_21_14_0_10_39_9]